MDAEAPDTDTVTPKVRRPIALVGFMGTGKTTVGRALARELGLAFVDLDAEVSRRTGLSIARLFEQEGEAAFRCMEVEALEDLVAGAPAVIGCGGGIVTGERGRAALGHAFVVYLAADEQALLDRLSRAEGKRPLLAGLEGAALARRVHELLVERRPLYAEVADLAVDSAKPTAEVVRSILRGLEAHEHDHQD